MLGSVLHISFLGDIFGCFSHNSTGFLFPSLSLPLLTAAPALTFAPPLLVQLPSTHPGFVPLLALPNTPPKSRRRRRAVRRPRALALLRLFRRRRPAGGGLG